jgi:hypothetical protein
VAVIPSACHPEIDWLPATIEYERIDGTALAPQDAMS